MLGNAEQVAQEAQAGAPEPEESEAKMSEFNKEQDLRRVKRWCIVHTVFEIEFFIAAIVSLAKLAVLLKYGVRK